MLGLTDGSLLSSRQGPFCPTTAGEDQKDPPCPARAREGEEAVGTWLYSENSPKG